MWSQIRAISLINLLALRSRLGSSGVVVVGVAGVVFVLTSLFAMVNGLKQTLRASGDVDRVLILGRGSHSEINGSITREQAAIIATLPGIASVLSRDRREPLASPEIYATVNLSRQSDGRRAGLPLRGVSEAAFRVRDEVRITRGRRFAPGRFELIVGEGAARVFPNLEVGRYINVKGLPFEVVGHFSADGRASESEAWMDVDVMANVFKRSIFLQSVLVRLEAPVSLARLQGAVDADRRLANSLYRESDFYAAQSESTTRLMTLVGWIAGIIMATGAIFAALNSLYAAVATRTREIATLRAIGFSAAPIIASVLIESLVLSLLGASLGALLGWAMFDGAKMAAVGATYSQVAFRFSVTAGLLLVGVLVAMLVGFVGGLLPAVSAARLSVVDGLRRQA